MCVEKTIFCSSPLAQNAIIEFRRGAVNQQTAKPAVPKLTQTERAYTVLKRAILQGEITEGAFLSEAEIMSAYAQQATLNFGKWLPSMTEALSAQLAWDST